MANTTRTKMKATTLFEHPRFDNICITWMIGSKMLVLASKGGPGEGAAILSQQPIKTKGDVSYSIAEAEALKWFDSIDVWEEAPEMNEGTEYFGA